MLRPGARIRIRTVPLPSGQRYVKAQDVQVEVVLEPARLTHAEARIRVARCPPDRHYDVRYEPDDVAIYQERIPLDSITAVSWMVGVDGGHATTTIIADGVELDVEGTIPGGDKLLQRHWDLMTKRVKDLEQAVLVARAEVDDLRVEVEELRASGDGSPPAREPQPDPDVMGKQAEEWLRARVARGDEHAAALIAAVDNLDPTTKTR